jgi:hypothetical protein
VEHVALKAGSEFRSSEAKEHKRDQVYNAEQHQTDFCETEEYYLLGYNAVWAVESHRKIRRNIFPPSLMLKNKPSKIRTLLATCFHAGIFFGLFFDLENGGDMFLRNVC